jgi:hypothetical protein
MQGKLALRATLIALMTASAGCNVIFGIDPGTRATEASASSGEPGSGGAGGSGGAASTSSSSGQGGAGGGMPSCPPSNCSAGQCPVTELKADYGFDIKGMIVTPSAVLMANASAIVSFPTEGGTVTVLPGTSGLGSSAWVTFSGGQLSWVNWDTANVWGISIEPVMSNPIAVSDIPAAAGPGSSFYGRIASSGGEVYWVTQQPPALWRAKADGSQKVGEQVASGGSPLGIAADATHVYWSDTGAKQILRKTISPLGPTAEVFAETNGDPTEVLLADGVVYWVTEGGAVQAKATEAPLADMPFTHTVDPMAIAKSIAVDSEFVYWTIERNQIKNDQGEVRRARHNKGDVVTLATGPSYFFEIALDCGFIYWSTNNLNNTDAGRVFRMAKPSN